MKRRISDTTWAQKAVPILLGLRKRAAFHSLENAAYGLAEGLDSAFDIVQFIETE
jgi:hypothetical protein